jgi:hypothetical protein
MYEFICISVYLHCLKQQNCKKKKIVHLYAEGNAVGVEGAICQNGKAYAEGEAVGV